MMRSVKLLKVAAQAEGLRWRRTGRSLAIRGGLGAGAAVFGLLLLLMLHIAGFAALVKEFGPVSAALILSGVDLVIMALLGWLAMRDQVDPVSIEAGHLRDDALRQVGDQAARAAVILPMMRGASAKKGIIGAAVTAALIGLVARR